MSKYTIGLDFGTLSGRGILVDIENGNIIAQCVKQYTHGVIDHHLSDGTLLPEGTALQDPMDYIEVLNTVIPSIIQGVDVNQIIGIGVDFTSCTMMPIDSFGIPLCIYDEYKGRKNSYVKLWKHHTAQKYADRINSYLEENNLKDHMAFGQKVSCELMIPKIMETKEEDPDLYEKTYAFVEAGDYITFLLTNSLKRSLSFAGYKNFYDQGYQEDDFYKGLDLEGIKRKFPGLVIAPGTNIRDGGLCEKWAVALGLKQGIAVSSAIIDSHAGVPASHITDEHEAMLVLGTSSVLIGLSKIPFSQNGIIGHVSGGIVPDYYALESGVAALGDLFQWFIENMVPYSYYQEAKKLELSIYDYLNLKAEKLKDSQVIVLDYWNGNKTPYVRSDLKGAIYGLTIHTKCEEIYKAMIEATAFSTKRILEIYQKQNTAIEKIICSGSVAFNNPYLMQIYADILNLPIYLVNCDQCAALGSAIYGAIASKAYDYKEAVEKMSKLKELVYLPDATQNLAYNELYQQYLKYSESYVEAVQ